MHPSLNCTAPLSLMRICIRTVLVIVMSVVSDESNGAQFVPLGFLDGVPFSQAASVSANGKVVVGQANGVLGKEAFVWASETGMQGIGDFPTGDFYSYASATSADGSYTIGNGTVDVAGIDGYRWNSITGMEAIGYLPDDPYQPRYSSASGVSGDGKIVVGGSRSISGNEAFRWTEDGGIEGLGQMSGAPIPNYYANIATDISADGQVIVGHSRSAIATEPFRWTVDEGMVGLGFLSGLIVSNYANAVSADGLTIVGYSSGSGGWRWTEATGMLPLSTTLSFGSKLIPNDVSREGSVIVGTKVANGTGTAFIWDSTSGTQTLNDFLETSYGLPTNGWSLQSAEGISEDGKIIVGHGINPEGRTEAWLIDLRVPEPSSLLLAITCSCVVARRRRP